jgi:hypothetical protein
MVTALLQTQAQFFRSAAGLHARASAPARFQELRALANSREYRRHSALFSPKERIHADVQPSPTKQSISKFLQMASRPEQKPAQLCPHFAE